MKPFSFLLFILQLIVLGNCSDKPGIVGNVIINSLCTFGNLVFPGVSLACIGANSMSTLTDDEKYIQKMLDPGKCENIKFEDFYIYEVCTYNNKEIFFGPSNTWYYGCYHFDDDELKRVECCQFSVRGNGLGPVIRDHKICSGTDDGGKLHNYTSMRKKGLGQLDLLDKQIFYLERNIQKYCDKNKDGHLTVAEIKEGAQNCNDALTTMKIISEQKRKNISRGYLKFKDGTCEMCISSNNKCTLYDKGKCPW